MPLIQIVGKKTKQNKTSQFKKKKKNRTLFFFSFPETFIVFLELCRLVGPVGGREGGVIDSRHWRRWTTAEEPVAKNMALPALRRGGEAGTYKRLGSGALIDIASLWHFDMEMKPLQSRLCSLSLWLEMHRARCVCPGGLIKLPVWEVELIKEHLR